MKTPKLPIFGGRDQTTSKGVAFDITTRAIQRRFSLNRNSLESALIHRAPSTCAMKQVPADRMGSRGPVEPVGKIFYAIAKYDEVPVIWHQAIGNYSHLEPRDALADDREESVVIGRGPKQQDSLNRAIHYVEGCALQTVTETSRHSELL
jgi:hypothetical protein